MKPDNGQPCTRIFGRPIGAPEDAAFSPPEAMIARDQGAGERGHGTNEGFGRPRDPRKPE